MKTAFDISKYFSIIIFNFLYCAFSMFGPYLIIVIQRDHLLIRQVGNLLINIQGKENIVIMCLQTWSTARCLYSYLIRGICSRTGIILGSIWGSIVFGCLCMIALNNTQFPLLNLYFGRIYVCCVSPKSGIVTKWHLVDGDGNTVMVMIIIIFGHYGKLTMPMPTLTYFRHQSEMSVQMLSFLGWFVQMLSFLGYFVDLTIVLNYKLKWIG